MFSSDNGDIKCALAERAIRTIKSRLWRLFESRHSMVYFDKLQDIVDSINNSVNRSHGGAPSEVLDNNSLEVFNKLYQKLIDHTLYKTPKFSEGDTVRVAYNKADFHKGFHPKFSADVFEVYKILKPGPEPVYELLDAERKLIKEKFYEAELVKVSHDKFVPN